MYWKSTVAKLVTQINALLRSQSLARPGNMHKGRRRSSAAALGGVAEVLEMRRLLSAANVTSHVVGASLTLTSDNTGDHNIHVYRKDSTTVEVDAVDNTTIDGASSRLFTFTGLVSGITINLGTGSDIYVVSSEMNMPALMIGAGGVVFQGAGGKRDDLEVLNNSNNNMTIFGNVTVQGTPPGSFLNCGDYSAFKLGPESRGFLTVGGSVSSQLNENGYVGFASNSVGTYNLGRLTVVGDVTESISSTLSAGGGGVLNVIASTVADVNIVGNVTQTCEGNFDATNYLNTTGSHKITVDGYVNQSATGGVISRSENQVGAGSPGDINPVNVGSIWIGDALTQNCNGTGLNDNEINTDGALTVVLAVDQECRNNSRYSREINDIFVQSHGSIAIGTRAGGVTQVGVGAVSTHNVVANASTGNLTIGGAVAQTAFGGNPKNEVLDDRAGLVSIVTSITQTAIDTAGPVVNNVYDKGNGNMTVGAGGINISVSLYGTTGPVGDVNNSIDTQAKGSLTTTGSINITTTDVSAMPGTTIDVIYTKGAASAVISAKGIVIDDVGPQNQVNLISTYGAPMNIGKLGITINGSGDGDSNSSINPMNANSPISVAGGVNVTESGIGESDFTMVAGASHSQIVVLGNVSYDNHLNSLGTSTVVISGSSEVPNSTVKINGSLNVMLADSSGGTLHTGGYNVNFVTIGFEDSSVVAGVGTIIVGSCSITGGNGPDIVGLHNTEVVLTTTIDLKGSPANLYAGFTSSDNVTIAGSTFVGNVLIAMSGRNATLDINDGIGFFPTIFIGEFTATMTGFAPIARISANLAPGSNPVVFFQGAKFIGKANKGGLVEYNPANVAGAISTHFFTEILV